MSSSGLLPTINLLAFVLCVIFLVYVALIVMAYLRERKHPAGDPTGFHWHLAIPCLDEEAVIERTVLAALRDLPLAHLWCVDDASTDRTAEILGDLAERHPRVHVLSRRPPHAQLGKGAALNHAWSAIRAWAHTHDLDPEHVIIGVLDADGELDPQAFDTLASDVFFGDSAVGAVQVAVRIANRSTGDRTPPASRWRRLLVDLQDVEFIGPIAAMQIMRRRTNSTAMGGNGQFTRLSVLDDIAGWAGTPWHGALLEDFELGLHVLLSGRDTAYCHQSWVAQEGLPSMRALVRQRSRWAQGSMQCSQYIGPVLASTQIRHLAAFEVTYFLLIPWLQLLGTAIYLLAYCILAWYIAVVGLSPSAWIASGQWGVLPLALLFGVGPFFVWGPIYRRRVEPSVGRLRSVLLGVALFGYSTMNFAACWWAFVRYLDDREDWKKTARVAGSEPAVAGDAGVYVPRRVDAFGRPTIGYVPRRGISRIEGAPNATEALTDARYDAWAEQLAGPRLRVGRRRSTAGQP